MTTDTAPKVKGTVIIAYAKFIKKKWGTDGLNDCSKHVGLDLADLQIEKWYPNQYQFDLMEWVNENHGIDMVKAAGTFMTTQRGIISIVARMAGIERVMERGVQEIRDSLRGGEVKVIKGDKTAAIKLKNLSSSPVICVAWEGVFEGVLKLTRTKGKVTETHCQHLGDEYCRFQVDWE